jgi:hypothetical protein
MVAGIGGAVVAVPLAAVTNTVVGYLRAHAHETAPGYAPQPREAMAVGAPSGSPPPENPAG